MADNRTPGDLFRQKYPYGRDTGRRIRTRSVEWQQWAIGGGTETEWRSADGRCRICLTASRNGWQAFVDGAVLATERGKARRFNYRATAMDAAIVKARGVT